MASSNIQFLVPFLYDGENMVQRFPGSGASDLTKKVHFVFDVMREEPSRLKASDVANIVYDANSQVANKDGRMAHYQRVGGITNQLITALLEKNPDLPLPFPKIGRAMGLVHDLSNAFARYDEIFNGEEKELSLYHLAVELGVPVIADAAQHNAYLEIADMITKRTGFAAVRNFLDWSDAYNNPSNPHRISAMFAEYGNPYGADGNDFAHGKDKLDLMILTIADCLDDGKSHKIDLSDISNLKPNFDLRMADIVARNYHDKIKAGKSPAAFGIALVENGGLKRMELYLDVISGLLSSTL